MTGWPDLALNFARSDRVSAGCFAFTQPEHQDSIEGENDFLAERKLARARCPVILELILSFSIFPRK